MLLFPPHTPLTWLKVTYGKFMTWEKETEVAEMYIFNGLIPQISIIIKIPLLKDFFIM